MVKIAFDTSALHPQFKAHAHRGIGRYARELQSYFATLTDPSVSISNFNFVELKSESIDALLKCVPIGKQTIRQQIVYPLSLAKASAGSDYIHFPAQMDAPAWGKRKYILTVHDLIPLVCADLYRSSTQNWKFAFGRWLELSAIRNASHIIAISQSTSNDLQRILKISPERISITHLGVDSKFLRITKPIAVEEQAVRAELHIPFNRRVVLYVGGIDPRKNYVGLLKTAKEVVSRYKEIAEEPPCFVIAGNIESDREFPKLLKLRKDLDIEGDVLLIGYVSEKNLHLLYGISSMLFFPSLYEGFGLTPLEALAAGLPVVTSNTSAMPEVVGDAAVLVSPQNYSECAAGIFSVLDNPSFSNDLAARGKARAKLFPWEKTGAETVKVYQSLESKCQ